MPGRERPVSAINCPMPDKSSPSAAMRRLPPIVPPSGAVVLSGLPPVSTPEARVLILGSMPGTASLKAARYYAHPRNAFWPIVGELFGFDPLLDYPSRLKALVASGVALWDVIGCCERQGSLDAAIVTESIVANDFSTFFAVHREIRHIFFNGQAAATAFRRHVLLPGLLADLPDCQILPSTSPAYAALSLADKRSVWSVLLAAARA